MSVLGYILIFTVFGSILSLIGGILLLINEKKTLKYTHFLAAFAAGTLLGTAFLELLPEAFEEAEHIFEEFGIEINIFIWALFGLLGFFLIERFIHWFHHHQHELDKNKQTEPTVPLVVIGDSVHNFIDGAVIAAAFLVNIPLGIITAIAVALHEVPQEIGDFGILLHKGVERKRVILLNLLSAFTAIIGALVVFFIGEAIEPAIPVLLAVTAGFFIYIAASDLIPEIHHENRKGFALIESGLLLFGVATVWFVFNLLHGVGGH